MGRVSELTVTGKVGGWQPEWHTKLGEEFTLPPRGDVERLIELESHLDLPSIERGGASCDVSVSALVCGPWEEGRAQRTQNLVPLAGIWLPTVGLEPKRSLLTEEADIDLKIEHYFTDLQAKARATRPVRVVHEQVSYTDLDRTLGLRPGAAKERLVVVGERMRHHVKPGPSIALVKVHDNYGAPVSPIVGFSE